MDNLPGKFPCEVKMEAIDQSDCDSVELEKARADVERLMAHATEGNVNLQAGGGRMDANENESSHSQSPLSPPNSKMALLKEIDQLQEQQYRDAREKCDMEKEIRDLKRENESLKKRGSGKTDSLEREVASGRDELKRLQKQVAYLREQRTERDKKYYDVKGRLEALEKGRGEEHWQKERKAMTRRVDTLRAENKELVKEHERREGKAARDHEEMERLRKENKQLMGEQDLREHAEAVAREEMDRLKEENKMVKEQLKTSHQKGLSVTAAVDKLKSSNEELTKQLDFYRKGWMTYHEMATKRINERAGTELVAGNSFPMPPSRAAPVPTPVWNSPAIHGAPSRTPHFVPFSLHPPVPPHHPPSRVIKTEEPNVYVKTEVE